MKARWLSLLMALAVFGPMIAFAEDHEHEDDRERPALGAEAVLEFVAKHSPPYHESLTELRRENPGEFEETVGDVAFFMAEYREVKRDNPEEAELMLKLEVNEVESELIARRFRETENPERRAELREALGKKLNYLFELKQHARERDLHYLELEMKELRERLHRRAEHRERIIERRMQDLLGEHEDDWMEW